MTGAQNSKKDSNVLPLHTAVTEDVTGLDLLEPEYYLNRELSLLEFNRRVLEQARDRDTPLLERLRFLCISSRNLDEFFEVRVAGVKQRHELGSNATGPDGLLPVELLTQINEIGHGLVAEQYRVLNEELLPALADTGIHFHRRAEWNEGQLQWLREYFEDQLLPILSPIGLDPAHPFPKVLNKSLNFIVKLEGKDAFGRNSGFAVVGAPRALPRIIELPSESGETADTHHFVFLSSIIHHFVDELFPGMRAEGCHQFRVTRNSDLFVDEEEIQDLKRALEGELPSRRYGDEVRLEVAHTCPQATCDFLLEQFELRPDELYQVDGPVNLNRLAEVCEVLDNSELYWPPFAAYLPPKLAHAHSIFSAIRKRDRLLHLPFDSFVPVIEFLRAAAVDPTVVAIKQTLYRTGADSMIVDALVAAARNGTEVTVVIELRARFDEQENIALANRLEEAGAHVVYGVVGYKTHAKMVLVVRREEGSLRHYVHLGTGNYHSKTARLYTDYGLFTADNVIGEEVSNLFLQLTSLGKASKLKQLLQSPFTLHKGLISKLEREAEHAREGRTARVIAKMNALTEPKMIRALYAASQAGVQIDLIIRGVCALRPGVPGVSDNIRVRSIIGRFLEHTRVYYFENGGESELFGASADWMERNLFQRVEVCFPISDKRLRQRVMEELDLYLADNRQAWELQTSGVYQRASEAGEPLAAQEILMAKSREALL